MTVSSSFQSSFIPAPPSLRKQVDRIWSWKAGEGVRLPTLLPGTGAELVFQCEGALLVQEGGAFVKLPSCFVFCLRSKSCRLFSPGPVHLVSVRFRAGGPRHFGRLGMEELSDRLSPGEEHFGPAIGELSQRLPGLPSLTARARAIAAFLEGHRLPAEDAGADGLLEGLYYDSGVTRVSSFAASLGLSSRTLERRVGGASGLTPKRFQRITRFHRVMRTLFLRQSNDYLETALAAGYHDQAHFIHDCQELTGRAPLDLLQPSALVSHFYNTSLRDAATLPVKH